MLMQDSGAYPHTATQGQKGKDDMTYDEMRHAVYETTMMLYDKDLIRLSAGNVSIHDGGGMSRSHHPVFGIKT